MDINEFKLLTKYNKEVNSKMNEIINSLTEEEWNKEFSGYYKSIHELCSHIYISDHRWLNKFRALNEYKSLNKDFFVKEYNFTELLFKNISEYITKRQELDKIMTDFANELEEGDLEKQLKFINSKGTLADKKLKIFLLHLSHHETHHRGMISLYLEMLGKENDYSNFYPYE